MYIETIHMFSKARAIKKKSTAIQNWLRRQPNYDETVTANHNKTNHNRTEVLIWRERPLPPWNKVKVHVYNN